MSSLRHSDPSAHRTRLPALPLIGALLLATLGACAAESGPTPDEPCPRGTQRNADGICVRPVDPGSTPGRTGVSSPPSGNAPTNSGGSEGSSPSGSTGVSPGTTPSDSTTPSPPSSSGACTPGQTACVDPVTRATCNADGTALTDEQPCADGQICRTTAGQATCVIGSVERCTPGEFVTCATPNRYFGCSERGFPDTSVSVPCPASTPNCRGALGCTDAICAPGTRTCEGNQIVACNDDGQGTTPVASCPAGCAAGACIDPCAEDGKGSYVGCEFYAIFLDNHRSECQQGCPTGSVCRGSVCQFEEVSLERFGVTVSNVTAFAVDVTVHDANDEVVGNATVAAEGLTYIPLPIPPGWGSGSRIRGDSTFRIEATGAVTVHQFNPPRNVGAFSNDASLLLPTNGLGTDYMVLNWPSHTVAGGGPTRFPAYVTVIATDPEQDTTVTVRPTAAIVAGPDVPAIAAGSSHTFTLERGRALTLYATDAQGADLSGTAIEASAPVAVFAGLPCANVPFNLARCDHIEQQLYPTDVWGDRYILAKFKPRGTEQDVYRIIALEAGTLLETSPVIPNVHNQTLGRGQVLQFQTRESFEVRALDPLTGAGRPIAVGQFMVGAFDSGIPRTCPANCSGFSCQWGIGDPSYLLAVPTRQYLTDYVFFVPSDYRENAISVVAPLDAEVRLNGNLLNLAAAGSQIPGIAWRVAHFDVPEGTHRLTSNRPIGLSVYGYDCNVSYAYPGGLNLETLP